MNDDFSVLIVEDEKNLGQTLKEYLEAKGFSSRLAVNAKEARQYFLHRPQIVILDIGLPDASGLDLAREFVQVHPSPLILFLSAQNDPDLRVEGLEIGAVDYITKPFDLRELILRLERWSELKKTPEDIIGLGTISINFSRFQLKTAEGELIDMGKKECAILKLLLERQGQAVDREEIIEQVWGPEQFPTNRTVDNYIVKLRKWCETDPSLTIKSVRGIGYKLSLAGDQYGHL